LLLALSFGVPSARAAAPRFVSGRAALRRLGPALGAVAKKHGLTPAELERLLGTDPTVHADADGDLVFMDRGESGASAASEGSSIASDGPAPFPLDETFSLHTDPGADRILYLDFDGGTYSGGAPPKSTILSPTPVTIPPFGGITPFSDETLAKIQWIWKWVAEDYAPFRLDVTTEEPTEEDLEDCADTCGARISIGGEPAEIGESNGVEGLAPYPAPPAFGLQTLPSAFVFTAGPFTTDEMAAANTISHEAGHDLGLLHDGTRFPTESEYYAGSNDWCPIMGSCFSPLSQWSKGEYPGANNQEDDLAVIAAIAPKRADDVPASGAPLAGAPDAVEQAGLIGDREDTDTFTFDTGGGPAAFTVEGAAPSPNLNAKLTLLDDGGTVVAAADDPDGLGATLATELPHGRYSLRVDGVGDNDPAPGYSDYDSLGRYHITGSYTPYQTLSVSRQGSGTGTVSSSPAGIDCGTVCSVEFSDEVVVQLNATPDVGSTFAGWSGACTGTGICSLPMTEAHSVVATFDRQAAPTSNQPAPAIATPTPAPRPTPTPGTEAPPAPTLTGHAKGKVTTLRVSCGDRACVVHVTATVVRKRSKLGALRALKKHLLAADTATLKLKDGKRLLAKVAGKHSVKVKVRAVFVYADGTRVSRVLALPAR
jgi:hypothetical protein